MAPVGLVSVACALGTVLGLALLVFGIARKSIWMRLGGGLTFLLCFSGLFFILAKYGYKPPQDALAPGVERWMILKWETREMLPDSSYAVNDFTRNWTAPPMLFVGTDNVRLGEGSRTLITRDFERSDSLWKFALENNGEGPALSGTYKLVLSDTTEIHLKRSKNNLTEEIWLLRKP